MCCFSGPVRHVSSTQIFARRVSDARQAVVYSMDVELDRALAMVLPVPIVPGAGDAALSFVDLSGYRAFFHDLAKAFPANVVHGKSLDWPTRDGRGPRTKLVVHDVGDFVASFVPSRGDFDRLDSRFRLGAKLFEARQEYADYGFAVFQLKSTRRWFWQRKRETIQPMAFTFETRRPRALFFPTLHVHDGGVPERAGFDHELYCQIDDVVMASTVPFRRSSESLARHVKIASTDGIVSDAPGFRESMSTQRRNIDQWYEPPPCAGAHVLHGRGEHFSFSLRAAAAYDEELEHPRARLWRTTARTKLDALHDALLEGGRALTKAHRNDWGLAHYDDALDELAIRNGELYTGTDAQHLAAGTERTFRMGLATDSDVVEPQQVELAFARVPPPELISSIRRAFTDLVERAAR